MGVARLSEDLIYSSTAWVTNAQMIQDVARLDYLRKEWRTLDPTPAKLAWWRLWKPDELVCRWFGEDPRWDARHMDYVDQCFDAVALDMPYVSVGGRDTTTIAAMHRAYGLTNAPRTPQGVQDDINAALAECYRVVRRGGIVLCKCQGYVTSGKFWDGVYHTKSAAYALGFQLVDQLNHISGARPQPEGRGPQKHSRRNQSDLLILKRPKRS